MKLVVGLGNPGEGYKYNRHNVGYMFIDNLSSSVGFTIAKTNSFMNDSGSVVADLLKKRKIGTKDLFIVHDDLDIPLGSYKIQFAVGPKVHNGLSDIEKKLGTADFWRVRIGVDSRDPENRIPGEKYVLEDFLPEEKKVIDSVIAKAKKDLYAKLQ